MLYTFFIGFDPFFIHYWTPTQIRIAKTSSTKNQKLRVSADATGGVCNRISRVFDNRSAYMFLYEIQAYFSETPAIPIAHMISEKHDTETIRQWLTRWKIDIGSQVQEFTSDQSLALMAAAVISFTQFSSLQRYIEECFKILNGREFELPLCFIRNDVAHFMKNVSTWKPLKDLKSSMSRKFFLQSYALIMQSTSLNEAREIIKSILIVFGVSPTDGMKICENEHTDERTIVEEKRLQLRKAIAGAPNHILDLENETFNGNLIKEEVCHVI